MFSFCVFVFHHNITASHKTLKFQRKSGLYFDNAATVENEPSFPINPKVTYAHILWHFFYENLRDLRLSASLKYAVKINVYGIELVTKMLTVKWGLNSL